MKITKSVVRHVLVSASAVAVFLGLNQVVPILSYAIENLDAVWSAVTVLVGVVVGLWGFDYGRTPTEE